MLAMDPKLRRQVALKVPHPHALVSPAARARFMREAEVAARLAHPHIVAVYEVGETGPICYIAAEYCKSGSLADWMARRTQRAAPREAASLVAELASRRTPCPRARGVAS